MLAFSVIYSMSFSVCCRCRLMFPLVPVRMYAGPSPFAKFNQGLRSDAAQRICALVTKPDHTVVQESGNCFQLPESGSDLEN